MADVALMFKQNVKLPALFDYVKRFFNFLLNLDLNGIPLVEYISALQKYTQWEFRVQFLFVNILVPLIMSLITLMLFENCFIISWYALVLMGVLAIAVGVLGYFLPTATYAIMQRVELFGSLEIPIEDPQLVLIIGGIVFTVICLGVGAIYLVIKISNRNVAISRQSAKIDRQQVKRQLQTQARRERLRQYGQLNSGGGGTLSLLRTPKVDHDDIELQLEHEALLSFSWSKTLVNLLTILICFIGGLFLIRVIKFRYFGWDNNPIDSALADNSISTACMVGGICSFLVGGFLSLQTFLNCFPCGRKLEYCCISLCKFNSLKIVMIVLTILYTPVVSSLFESFMCKKVSCDLGSRFPVNYNMISLDTILQYDYGNSSDKAASVCEACIFHPNCNCSIDLTNTLCPSASSWRLVAEPSLACLEEMPFFWPATVLLGLTFGLGVPIFFFVLTCKSAEKLQHMDVEFLLERHVPLWIREPKKGASLEKKYGDLDSGREDLLKERKWKKKPASEFLFMQTDPPPELVLQREIDRKRRGTGGKKKSQQLKGSKAEAWEIRTALTNNPAKSLYHAFESKWRYFRMITILVKLLLVVSSIVFLETNDVSLPLTFAIHCLLLGMMLISWPYLNILEDWMSIVVAVVSSIDAIFNLIAYYAGEPPSWSFYPMVTINAVIPILAIVLLFYSIISRKTSSRKFSHLIQRLEKLQKAGEINIRKRINFKGVRQNIHDTDELLTITSMKVVLCFFMFLGVSTFLSLVFAGLGLLYGELNPAYIPNQYDVVENAQEATDCEAIQLNEFAGYLAWENFTDHCCCSLSDHHASSAFGQDYVDVEMWWCDNGYRKERIRSRYLVDSTGERRLVNGTELRPLCGKTFDPRFEMLSPCQNGSTVEYSYLLHISGDPPAFLNEAGNDPQFSLLKYYW